MSSCRLQERHDSAKGILYGDRDIDCESEESVSRAADERETCREVTVEMMSNQDDPSKFARRLIIQVTPSRFLLRFHYADVIHSPTASTPLRSRSRVVAHTSISCNRGTRLLSLRNPIIIGTFLALTLITIRR